MGIPKRLATTIARFEEFRAAVQTARITAAAELLNAHPELRDDPRAPLLIGRLALLRDDAPGAIGALSASKPHSRRENAERLMLLGSAHARVGEYAVADTYFEKAELSARTLIDADLNAELACRRGRRYVMANDLASAYLQLPLAQQGQSLRRRIDALLFESFILNVQARYRQDAEVLIRLLDQIDPHDEELMLYAAWATQSLAVLIREMHIPHAIPTVERQLSQCAWHQDFDLQRFVSLKALGWSHALRGDYFNAFRYLKQSANFAPSPAWEAISLIDRAYLARCLSEERWSRQELAEAEEIAQSVNWRATKNEERIALLLFAEMFASLDAGKAAQYMAQFRELGELHAPLLNFNYDDRLSALANYSAGVTQLALGNHKAGIKMLRESFSVYDRVGYDWRAGRCAMRLYEATNDASYLASAQEKLRNYMSSWLGDELRAVGAKVRKPSLPPMQRRIFEEICRGLSTSEIAAKLGRSEFTVRNHIKLIFKAYEVNSRTALVAEAVRRNLV